MVTRIFGAAAPLRDPLTESPWHRPTSSEKKQVDDYTRKTGNDLVFKIFHVDLELLQLTWQKKFNRYSTYSTKKKKKKSSGSAIPAGLSGNPLSEPTKFRRDFKVSLKIDQTDDIRRMQADPWDIPFAVRIKMKSRLIKDLPEFKTEIYVPVSGKDELWIKTSGPVPGISDTDDPHSIWTAYSNYSNHQGLSTLKTGLGRQWFGDWNFRYAYWIQFKDLSRGVANRQIWSVQKNF